MPSSHYPSAAVRRALRKLGVDIRDARRRRRLPMAVVAERAFTSRSTLQRSEEGDPNAGIGIYAAVLNALGLLDGVGELADIAHDTMGPALATAELPLRAHTPAAAEGFQWLISRSPAGLIADPPSASYHEPDRP